MWLLRKSLCLSLAVISFLLPAVLSKTCYECDANNQHIPCFQDGDRREPFAETSCSSSDVCFSLGTEDGTKIKGCGSEEHVKEMGATVGRCAGVWSNHNLIGALEKVREASDARRRKPLTGGQYTIIDEAYTICACKGELCNRKGGRSGNGYGSSGRKGASQLLLAGAFGIVIALSICQSILFI